MTKCKITNLTTTERKALPGTLGAIPHERSEYYNRFKTCDLSYGNVIDELLTALHIGLENYIDSASWRVCDIIKARANTNKIADMWQLYVRAVCGNYTNQEINVAWCTYTRTQQQHINKQIQKYIDYLVEHLQSDVS